jgi:hypothetical protein
VRRVGLALLAVVLAAGLLAGCGTVSALVDTTNALRSAGYSSPNVSIDANNDAIDVSVAAAVAPTPTVARDVARVVWNSFHERFDVLDVTVHGSGPDVTASYSFDQLVQLFGARPAAWNRTSVRSGALQAGVVTIVVVAVVVALAVVVVVLALRHRRSRRALAGYGFPGFPGGGPPGSYPPAGPPPGSYPPYGPPPGSYPPAGPPGSYPPYGPPPGSYPPAGPPPGSYPPYGPPPGPYPPYEPPPADPPYPTAPPAEG